jgi:hypothetical protein
MTVMAMLGSTLSSHNLDPRHLNSLHLRQCPLCLSGETEDLEHIMRCSALNPELREMSDIVRRKLRSLNLDTSKGSSLSQGERLRKAWFVKASNEFSPRVSPKRIHLLIDDWIRTNGVQKAYRNFSKALSSCLNRPHSDGVLLPLPKNLLKILSKG